MTYVTLQPHSAANPSGMHVVTDMNTWLDAFSRGAAVNPIASCHTFQEAEDIKNKLNQETAQ